MAVGFDTASSGANAEQASLTVSHTAGGADRYAVITVGTISNQTSTPATTSCTYGGNACTKVAGDGRSLGTNRYLQCDVFIYADPPASAQNVVVSLESALAASLVVATYTGVDVHGAVGNADGSGTAASCSVTTTVANTYVTGGVAAFDGGSQTLAPGTSVNERAEQAAPGNFANDDHRAAAADKAAASAGAVTFDYTLGVSAVWAIAAVELKPAAASGQPPRTMHQFRMRG